MYGEANQEQKPRWLTVRVVQSKSNGFYVVLTNFIRWSTVEIFALSPRRAQVRFWQCQYCRNMSCLLCLGATVVTHDLISQIEHVQYVLTETCHLWLSNHSAKHVYPLHRMILTTNMRSGVGLRTVLCVTNAGAECLVVDVFMQYT